MRLIEINHWKELNEKLQNLKGKEYLYVKINGVSRTGWTKAIDLKKFKGTLDITFANSKKFYFLEVQAPENVKMQNLFFNSEKATILLNCPGVLKIDYVPLPKQTVAITNETDLNQPVYPNDILTSNEDLVLTKKILLEKKIDVLGHKVFLSSKHKALQENFLNAQFIYYDQLLEIQNISDWYALEKLTNGTTVVLVKNDIEILKMKALNLSKYSGDLYILGNHHFLQNGIIFFSNASGFIEELHPYANLYIKDLNFQNLMFLGENPSYCGTILGQRNKKGYQSPEGNIYLENCWISDINLPNAFINTDVFIGDNQLPYTLIDSGASKVYIDEKRIYPSRIETPRLERKNKNV